VRSMRGFSAAGFWMWVLPDSYEKADGLFLLPQIEEVDE